MKLKIKTPATTANLGPGFDCLGASLSLYNEFEVYVVKNSQKLRVETEGVDCELISKKEDNHFYKAIKKIFEITKNEMPSLEIYIKNRIPLKRGLGSSATAYVAGVVLGNILCGEPLSENELLKVALELEGHPDNIVPCMFGGLCISSVVEGSIKFIKLKLPSDILVLAVIPKHQISTEDARKILPDKIYFKDAVKNVSNVALLVSSLTTKKYEFLKFATEDFLHQPYRKKLMPWMDKVFEICLDNKALCCMLSGSGSTVVALYRKKELDESLKERLQEKLQKIVDCQVKILSFTNKGIIVY
ncbi:MAG: homoserine kinase [Candidatus Anstonellales archaeon]